MPLGTFFSRIIAQVLYNLRFFELGLLIYLFLYIDDWFNLSRVESGKGGKTLTTSILGVSTFIFTPSCYAKPNLILV